MIDTLKNKNSTFNKSLGMLKTFTNWAIEKKLVEKNIFESIKISKIPGQREYLDTDELRLLEKFYQGDEINPGVKNSLRYFGTYRY